MSNSSPDRVGICFQLSLNDQVSLLVSELSLKTDMELFRVERQQLYTDNVYYRGCDGCSNPARAARLTNQMKLITKKLDNIGQRIDGALVEEDHSPDTAAIQSAFESDDDGNPQPFSRYSVGTRRKRLKLRASIVSQPTPVPRSRPMLRAVTVCL